jgi:DNA-directed RNA polymerase specialized sigma24 family protein
VWRHELGNLSNSGNGDPHPESPLEPTPAGWSATGDEAGIGVLLSRMRAGERDAAATFIQRYGLRIRRRVRGKLSPTVRRVFDSHDILSTVGRRLDLYVRAGRMAALREDQLWSLVLRMVDHAVIDKVRLFRHLRSVRDEDGSFACSFLRHLEDFDRRRDARIEVDAALSALPSEADRDVLRLWLAGHTHGEIAARTGSTLGAVRWRWKAITARLRERFAPAMHAAE